VTWGRGGGEKTIGAKHIPARVWTGYADGIGFIQLRATNQFRLAVAVSHDEVQYFESRDAAAFKGSVTVDVTCNSLARSSRSPAAAHLRSGEKHAKSSNRN